jgi:uncharacterized protein
MANKIKTVLEEAEKIASKAELDLQTLLRTMKPEIQLVGDFAFVTLTPGEEKHRGEAAMDELRKSSLMCFGESEGLTLIVPVSSADQNNLNYDGAMKCITLTVHSSLQAVGLTAAVSNVLASAGIPANVVAAYYHDHIFVPTDRSAQAIALLEQCSAAAAVAVAVGEESV